MIKPSNYFYLFLLFFKMKINNKLEWTIQIYWDFLFLISEKLEGEEMEIVVVVWWFLWKERYKLCSWEQTQIYKRDSDRCLNMRRLKSVLRVIPAMLKLGSLPTTLVFELPSVESHSQRFTTFDWPSVCCGSLKFGMASVEILVLRKSCCVSSVFILLRRK